MKENIFKVTPYGLGTNSFNQPMLVVILPCIILDGKWDHLEKARVHDIGVVMSKSKRRARVLLVSVIVGFDFRCLGIVLGRSCGRSWGYPFEMSRIRMQCTRSNVFLGK